MPIPVKLNKEQFDSLPDFLKEGYEQQSDGSYVLEAIPGMVDKAKVDEFRNNNRELQTQLEEMKKQMATFEGVDLEEFKILQEQKRQLEEKELIEAGEIDKIVEARVRPLMEAKDSEYTKLKESYEQANNQLSVLMIDDATTSLATELGVEPTALMDVKSRARQQFRIKNGKVIATDAEGKPMYGPDGITPLSLDKSWMEGLKKNAGHLFRPAQGTGAQGDNGTRNRSGTQDTSKLSSVQKISAALNEQDGNF